MELIKSDSVLLRGVVDSQQGGRPENQDDYGFAETPFGFLFIVCDGMGGGPGGKTASYNVKYEIAKALSTCSPQTPCDKAFRMAVGSAHEALLKKMEEVPQLVGMGSTFVAVLLREHSAIIAHAGDSRCYQIRGKRLVYRTQDHSLVGELVRKKALTEEQARISPQSNVITRGLGSISNNTPDVEEVPYRKGDRFILCTDGVWGIMPHEELMKRFTAKEDIKKIILDLSVEIDDIGNKSGGYHDNHTMGLIEMDCDSSLKPSIIGMFKTFDFRLPDVVSLNIPGDKLGKYLASAVAALLIILLGYWCASKLFDGVVEKNGDSGGDNTVKVSSGTSGNEDVTKVKGDNTELFDDFNKNKWSFKDITKDWLNIIKELIPAGEDTTKTANKTDNNTSDSTSSSKDSQSATDAGASNVKKGTEYQSEVSGGNNSTAEKLVVTGDISAVKKELSRLTHKLDSLLNVHKDFKHTNHEQMKKSYDWMCNLQKNILDEIKNKINDIVDKKVSQSFSYLYSSWSQNESLMRTSYCAEKNKEGNYYAMRQLVKTISEVLDSLKEFKKTVDLLE